MVMEIAVRKPQIKGKNALVLVSDKDCKTIEKFCGVMKAFRNSFKINKETGMLINTFTGCEGGIYWVRTRPPRPTEASLTTSIH